MAMLLDGGDRRTQLGDVLNGAVGNLAAGLSSKVDGWADRLDDMASGAGHQAMEGLEDLADEGGAKQQALTRGAIAGVRGKNPLWAALKGAWSGGSAAGKAAIVTALVGALLLAVISPVLLLVFLISLLIIAAVEKARS